jgi:hypothetical protein
MEVGDVRPCAKPIANPAIVPATVMAANIRSFLSSLAFMMHPRVTPGRLYTAACQPPHDPRNDRVGAKI